MPRPTRFLPGQLYGRLTAIKRSERSGYGCFTCICGATKEVLIGHVTQGRVQSCGCLQKERASQSLTKRQTTHGQSGMKTYAAWRSMRQRCENPNVRAYINYGARGIKVCARWKKFENFLEDMGECPPGLTLERKDNSRGYAPNNCIWADWSAQANNRRDCKQITYLGKTQTVSQWAAELNLPRGLLYDRLAAGWSPKAAFITPKRSVGGAHLRAPTMKRITRREVRRLREKQRQEELDRYTALCMQARMLCELDSGAHDLMNNVMKAVEHLSYGVLVSSVRDLQFVLNDIAHGAVVELFKTYYLLQHWVDVCRQISIHPRTYAHEKTSATTRPGPVRPQAKIPGQAARFQNYRR